MQNNCDLLILTARFGTGHISVSNAIKEHIFTIDKELQVKTIDLYETLYPKSFKWIYKSYEVLVKKAPFFYNLYYLNRYKLTFINHKKANEINKHPLIKFDPIFKKKLCRIASLIEELNPKIVLSTFPICTEYISKYKLRYQNNLQLFTCITDVVDNSEWLHKGNDFYFIPHDTIATNLTKKGICTDQFQVTGIPIKKRFLIEYDKEKLKEEYGYMKEDRIILIMGGGLGLVPKDLSFYRWLDQKNNIKLVILTSKNKKLHDKLLKLDLKNSVIEDHTDVLPEYMQMAQMIIGKAGGITLFECIASRLPIIVYKPILGQELVNCKFICDQGIGIATKNVKELKKGISALLLEDNRQNIIMKVQQVRATIQMDKLAQKIVDALK